MFSACTMLAVVPSETGKETSANSSSDGGMVAPTKRPVIDTAAATAEGAGAAAAPMPAADLRAALGAAARRPRLRGRSALAEPQPRQGRHLALLRLRPRMQQGRTV